MSSVVDPSPSPPGLRRKPYLTWALLSVNLLLWLLVEMSGGSTNTGVLLKFGAMEAQHIAAGDYWRLFTATFLHSGLMHISFNCIALFIFGQQLEPIYGRGRFLAIYFIAGLAGSVTSYALSISAAPNTLGVGASGAIFGVLGGLVAFYAIHRDRFGEIGRQSLTGLLVIVAINVVFGFVVPGVDNFAHIGGFIAGLLIGLAYSPIYHVEYGPYGWPQNISDINSMLRRWWVLPAAATVLVAGIFMGNLNLDDTPIPHLRRAEEYRLQGEITLALDELDRAIQIDPYHSLSYLRRGQLMAELGNSDHALTDLGRAIYLSNYDSRATISLSDSDHQAAIRLMAQLSGR